MAVTLVLAGDWDRMSSIERYLKLRFEHRTLPGLKAKYRGPRKLKNSGKAAGSKKKKTGKGSGSSNKPKSLSARQKNKLAAFMVLICLRPQSTFHYVDDALAKPELIATAKPACVSINSYWLRISMIS